ncbi:MAG TPA: serine/threonine protein kinase [Gammaproteobacteria bacterium]
MEAIPYARLTPDVILGAAEACGFEPNGRVLALNSYENRVYQIGTETGFIVAKFYRPGRWTDAAILEEHEFALELARREIPVVPPLVIGGETLHEHEGYRYALYERRGGRWPELATREERVQMGRFLGRIHAVGAVRPFRERPTLEPYALCASAAERILAGNWLPPHLVDSYRAVTRQVLDGIARCLEEAGPCRRLRLHGDCHPGNVLWTDSGPHFVDLDDCVNGPAVQDLWLFLSGGRDEMAAKLQDLLDGYREFADFDPRELRLIEALRSARLVNYTAWITDRWADPAFPRAFPWITENKYWEDHVLTLKEQLAAMDEAPLPVR